MDPWPEGIFRNLLQFLVYAKFDSLKSTQSSWVTPYGIKHSVNTGPGKGLVSVLCQAIANTVL